MLVKVSVVLGLFLIACGAQGYEQKFAPENDAWIEDCVSCESAGVSQEVFERIADVGLATYKEEIAERKERLTVKKDWTNSQVNAYAQRSQPEGGQVTIALFGGLARRKEIDARGMAIVFCHEANHLYPLWANYWDGAEEIKMGSEGAADTGATTLCFKRLAAEIPELMVEEDFEPFVNEKCGDDLVCKNSLVGGKQLANLLSALGKGPHLEFKDMATEKVSKTISYGYPRVQCRLTSYVFGTLNLGRPSCWYKEGNRPEMNW
jgi:hypothetical protein